MTALVVWHNSGKITRGQIIQINTANSQLISTVFKLNCYHLAQKNYLKVYFFLRFRYDFVMILLWFCYGFDVVENMVFLWFETISWRRYEFRYGFVMVWTCLQPAYFDRFFQDMYLYFWHILKLLLNLLKKKKYKFKNEKMKREKYYIYLYIIGKCIFQLKKDWV